MQKKVEREEVTSSLLQQEKILNLKLNEILIKDDEKWRLKSHGLWLSTRDGNTKYFHTQVQAYVFHNKVKEIETPNGAIVRSFEEIK